MPSIYDASSALFDGFPQDDVVRSVIRAADGVSELYVMDRCYNEVGRGVGELSLDLTPGAYKLRQRIGDTERVSSFEVGQATGGFQFGVASLDYSSPVPLAGTTTFDTSQAASEALLPRSLKRGLRVVVRDPAGRADKGESGTEALEHLTAELSNLSVETLKGKQVAAFSVGTGLNKDTVQFTTDIELEPGYYVVVQKDADSRQQCLPIFVHENWWPQLHLLSLRDKNSKVPVALQLENASISYRNAGAQGQPDDLGAARLEAARKALSRGRAIGGWSDPADAGPSTRTNDPLLGLMDGYLRVSAWSKDNDKQVQRLIDETASQLGNNFPDVIALRLALAQARSKFDLATSPEDDSNSTADIALSGPPLLSKSWAHLLRVFRSGKAISRAMPFQFVVGPSRGWFIWFEEDGARTEQTWATRIEEPAEDSSHLRFFELAQDVLIRLVQSEKAQEWLEKIQEELSSSAAPSSRLFSDPLVRNLAASLALLADPVLRGMVNDKALHATPANAAPNSAAGDDGATEMVRRALRSQGLPDDHLELALKKFLEALKESGLLTELLTIVGATLAFRLGALVLGSRDKSQAT